MIVAMIAHGMDHKKSWHHQQGWPFVTLTSFQERAHTVKDLSGVLYIGFYPIVEHDKRLAWENYTQHHADAHWYAEGREYQKHIGTDDLDNRPQVKTDDPQLDLSTGVANHIYDFQRDTTGKGVISPEADWYLPIWQVSTWTAERFAFSTRKLSVSDCCPTVILAPIVAFFHTDLSSDAAFPGEPEPYQQLQRFARVYQVWRSRL